MTTNSDDQISQTSGATSNSTPTAKIVTLSTPAPRSSAAKNFLEQQPETPEVSAAEIPETPLENLDIPALEDVAKAAKRQQNRIANKTRKAAIPTPTNSDRKHKAAVRYMQQHGIKDAESIDYTRLNCDIPRDLHNWLNMFSRSGSGEYASMTEIVIDQLGDFAKERGFKVGKK